MSQSFPDHPDELFPTAGPIGGGYLYPDGSAMLPGTDGKGFVYIPACVLEEMIPLSW